VTSSAALGPAASAAHHEEDDNSLPKAVIQKFLKLSQEGADRVVQSAQASSDSLKNGGRDLRLGRGRIDLDRKRVDILESHVRSVGQNLLDNKEIEKQQFFKLQAERNELEEDKKRLDQQKAQLTALVDRVQVSGLRLSRSVIDRAEPS